MAHPHDRFATVNGLRLHYLDWGSRGKPALVLLHGGSAYAQWWDFFAPAFADDFHVIAPDWRGHGDSQHAEPRPTAPAITLTTCTSCWPRSTLSGR